MDEALEKWGILPTLENINLDNIKIFITGTDNITTEINSNFRLIQIEFAFEGEKKSKGFWIQKDIFYRAMLEISQSIQT